MDVLIVVDMQNDFVSGALGTPEAAEIVPRAADRVAAAVSRGEEILFTRDTHGPGYLDTQEGRKLPVPPLYPGHPGLGADRPAAAVCGGADRPGQAHLRQRGAGAICWRRRMSGSPSER